MINIFLCSPHAGGVTDTLGRYFKQGILSINPRAEIACFSLRNYAITPCSGCGACAVPPHDCIYASDDTEFLFKKLLTDALSVFISPIYFYSLPAHFKGFIDRAQRYWVLKKNGLLKTERGRACAIFAGARLNGENLFTGAALTFKYFLECFDLQMKDTWYVRGVEEVAEMEKNPEIKKELLDLGIKWHKAEF